MLDTFSPTLRLGLSRTEAAALLGVTRQTMNNWERAGYGPTPVREGSKPGSRVLYDRGEIEAFAAGAVQ